jgi:hypothetical protein
MMGPQSPASLVEALPGLGTLPELQELHLIGFDEGEGTNKVWAEIRKWSLARGVRLFTDSPSDLWEPIDPSLYRFLDGVKARLGLDV